MKLNEYLTSSFLIVAAILFLTPQSAFAKRTYKSIMQKAGQHFLLNQYDKAYPLFKEALKLNPKGGDARAGIAWITFQTRAFNKDAVPTALKEAERAVKDSPKSPLVHNVLGAIYFSVGRFPEAQKEFRTVLLLDPKRRCWGCGDIQALVGPLPQVKKTNSKKVKKK